MINNSDETYTRGGSGAIATVIAEVRAAAARDGVEVGLLTSRQGGEPLDGRGMQQLRVAGVPRHPFLRRVADKLARVSGWRSARSLAYCRAVSHALRTHGNVTTVVLHNDPDVALRIARWNPRLAVLHLFHNDLDYDFSAQGSRVRHLAVSDWLAGVVQHRINVPVTVVPNGVDADRFVPSDHSTPRKPPVVCFLGRTGREKGLDLLLEALVRLREQGHQMAVLIIGSNTWGEPRDDDYQRSLGAQVEALRGSGVNVETTGHVARPQLPSVLGRADILVVPSRWEDPAPLVLMEGMSAGLPVVAARSGGMPEYGLDACLWFERGDVEGLTRQLTRLLDDESFRRTMSARARALACSLTWDRTWSILATCVDQSGPPPAAVRAAG